MEPFQGSLAILLTPDRPESPFSGKEGFGVQTPIQQVLNPAPLNPAPATCHKRKRKLRCSFRNAALQKLHCNTRFSAVPTSFVPEPALQRTKICTATSKSLRCRKVALSCRFPAGFKPPRLGTHVYDLLTHFSPPSHGLEKGVFGQKLPISGVFPCFLTENSLFPGRGEMGIFGPRNPLFQRMGIRDVSGVREIARVAQ